MNIIMKYQEQFVNIPGKHGLTIKSKQRIELFDIISCQLPTIKLYDIFFIYSELDFFLMIYSYKLLQAFPQKHL